uniref:Zona pellucida domain-containing protein 1 n=1 Tax=Branchiostoma belcheri TaxID=7741 RepID=U3LLY5_BRABE|nr:zona pellucida domain-containing protein 1 [Branchiostoma belcheri]
MASIPSLLVLVSTFVIPLAEGSHFRGGTISWLPLDAPSETSAVFRFNLGWKKMSATGTGCDTAALQGQTLVTTNEDPWECVSGCASSGTVFLANQDYYCTEFNVGQNWAKAFNSFAHDFRSTEDTYVVGYESCCWLQIQNQQTGVFHNPLISLRTTVDLGFRSDNGKGNHAPATSMQTTIRVTNGCLAPDYPAGKLAVADIDGDTVKCRFAQGATECGEACDQFPGLVLNEDCTYSYNGPASITISSGTSLFFVVAVMVEDFPVQTIFRHNQEVPTTQALSSVPLQFLIEVKNDPGVLCGSEPVLTGATPAQDTCLPIPDSVEYTMTVEAQPVAPATLAEINVLGPKGMTKSALTVTGDISSTTITWTPAPGQRGPHIVCFYAEDSNAVQSDRTCVSLMVGGSITPPAVDAPTLIPTPGTAPTDYPCDTTLRFSATFDQLVLPPTSDTFIIFYDSTNAEFYKHNTKIPDGQPAPAQSNTYVFDVPANTFQPLGTYTIAMQTGALEGVTGCGAGAGVQSDAYETAGGTWSFTCKFYIPAPVTTAPPAPPPATTAATPGATVRVVGTPAPGALPTMPVTAIVVTCSPTSITVTIPLSEITGVNAADIRYRSAPCLPVVSGDSVSITTGFQECGTTMTTQGDELVYENEIHTEFTSTAIRGNSVDGKVECAYDSNTVVTGKQFSALMGSVFGRRSSGQFEFSFDFYTDNTFSTAFTSYPVSYHPNQEMFIGVHLVSTNTDLVLFADNCKATPGVEWDSSPSYTIRQNGCNVDPLLTWYEPADAARAAREENFGIVVFRFADYSTLYIHCDVVVCAAADTSSYCATAPASCGTGRKRRDADVVDKLHRFEVTSGPVKIIRDDGGHNNNRQAHGDWKEAFSAVVSPPVLGVLMVCLGVIFLSAAVSCYYLRRYQQLYTTVFETDHLKPSILS